MQSKNMPPHWGKNELVQFLELGLKCLEQNYAEEIENMENARELAFILLVNAVTAGVFIQNGNRLIRKTCKVYHKEICQYIAARKMPLAFEAFWDFHFNWIPENFFRSGQIPVQIEFYRHLRKNKFRGNAQGTYLITYFEKVWSLPFKEWPAEFLDQIFEEKIRSAKFLREHGQYNTSPNLVRFMLSELPCTSRNLEITGRDIRVLDPSCGTGNFAAEFIRKFLPLSQLADRGEESNFFGPGKVFFYGMEPDTQAFYLAVMKIISAGAPFLPGEKQASLFLENIFLERTECSLTFFLDPQIPPAWQKKFDVILGNPPYIGYNLCSRQEFPFFRLIRERRVLLNNIFGINLHSVPGAEKKYAPKPNFFSFFIAQAYYLLGQDGVLCYLLPQTILISRDMDVVRFFLSRNMTILKIIIISTEMFQREKAGKVRTVATSSLVLIAEKTLPDRNHSVEINFLSIKDIGNLEEIKSLANGLPVAGKKKWLRQSELVQSYANWNFIKFNKSFAKRYDEILQKSQSMEIYYNHKKAEKAFAERFYFDKGAVFKKKDLERNPKTVSPWPQSENGEFYFLPQFPKFGYMAEPSERQIPAARIRFPHGSQGFPAFNRKYKIIWRYMNPEKFFFCEARVIINFNYVMISSDSRAEILFLFAILNSSLTQEILGELLGNSREKDLLLGIKSIKELARIPMANDKNLKLKRAIVRETEKVFKTQDTAHMVDGINGNLWDRINRLVEKMFDLDS